MKKNDFRNIFRSSFRDPADWQEWFFREVVVDENQIYLAGDYNGRAASALLMQPYSFMYQKTELPSVYVSCVATLPQARSHGFSSLLISDALSDARSKGYALAELIPAERNLYFFYERFGFATVFYTDQLRYTSLHPFADAGEIVPAEYDLFHKLEAGNGSGVIHSPADFRNILADLSYDDGHEVIAATSPSGGSAILFATYNPAEEGGVVNVRSLLSDSEEAADTALAELRRRVGARPFTVHCPPVSDSHAFLRPYGMVRILDPLAVFNALAAANPALNTCIRIHDPLMHDNSGIYNIAEGRASRIAQANRIDLDVRINTLASILFSTPKVGGIFSLPTERPYMALMLD